MEIKSSKNKTGIFSRRKDANINLIIILDCSPLFTYAFIISQVFLKIIIDASN